MKVTIKFLKQWKLEAGDSARRTSIQRALDAGCVIHRELEDVSLYLHTDEKVHVATLRTLGEAVKFAAALNKCRRPLKLIKADLDKDWAARVKERDHDTCLLCGIVGDKIGGAIKAHTKIDEDTGEKREVKARVKRDVLTAHHWLKTKARAGMARWARACGATVHYAEHIHLLHENPCWLDLDAICTKVAVAEGGMHVIEATVELAKVAPTEYRVRKLWAERCAEGLFTDPATRQSSVGFPSPGRP